MMINAAHASRFHWGVVGTPLNFARGEWQISRLCLENQLGDFDLGFAYEAMARAYAVQRDTAQREDNIELAKSCAERIDNEENRTWLLKNLNTVESLSLPKWEHN